MKKDVLNQTIMELQIQNQNLEERIMSLKVRQNQNKLVTLKKISWLYEQDEYIFQFNNKIHLSLGLKKKERQKHL